MKKNIVFYFSLFFIFSHLPVSAAPIRKEIREEFRQEIKNEIRATLAPTISAIKESLKNTGSLPVQIKNEIKETNRGLLDQIKDRVKEMVKKKIKFAARLTGKITAINGSQLAVLDKEGKNYSVLMTKKTKLIRRFGGKSQLSEFKVGDEVNVIGHYTNKDKTTIEAVLIRNLSIAKRRGVFFGEVVSLFNNSLVIKNKQNDQITVYLTSTTRLINRREEKINFADIKIGHRIRVKGVWDKELKEIREVGEIKDYSLPPILTPIPKQE